jgi:hypothetical protein
MARTMPVSTSIAFFTSANVPVPSLGNNKNREKMLRRELRCEFSCLVALRLPELVLFKNRTGAVQPFSLTPYTAKDVPRIMIVRLDRRSKRDFVSVCENLFRYLLAVYLFEQGSGSANVVL